MSTAADFYNKSELALSAYADFSGGITNYQTALVNAGMSDKQATEFALQWTVLSQFPDATNQTNSGVSATLFQNKLTGEISLAIRGTEPTLTDIGADGLLAIGISSKLNPRIKGVSIELFLEKPCHVAHALS